MLASCVAVCAALADAKPHLGCASRRTGRELRKVCMLNLSHCLLKLGRAAEAEAEASAVIALDKRSLKGYYRRCAPHTAPLRTRVSVCVNSRAARGSPVSQWLCKAQCRGAG